MVGNDSLGNLVNQSSFDFQDKIFQKYDINKSDIESIMLAIGAVDKFEDLSIEAVNKIVKQLPEKSKNGKNTQTIYKRCVEHFQKNKKKLNGESIKLFATKENKQGYFLPSEIFYSGNIKLPRKITNSKAILNYPRRQSTKNVVDFFGVSSLDLLKIEVVEQKELSNQTTEFNKFFEQRKHCILAYRIQKSDNDETRKNELAKLKTIKIKLCNYIQYSVNGEHAELEDNDYIKNNGNYLIRVNNNISIDDIREDFDFQESFADIIGIAFDIQETKVFRDMIKEKVSYIERTIENDIGRDALIAAKELLDISDEFNSFWSAVYQLKGKKYTNGLNHDFAQIKKDLGIILNKNDIDYSNLSDIKTCGKIAKLFNELGITIEAFNVEAYYKY